MSPHSGRDIRYTASARMRCRKQQRCWACGALFSFAQEREMSAVADTADEARQEAISRVRLVLDGELDHHPCPDCWRWQPERALDARRKRRDAAVVLAVAAVLALAGTWMASAVTGRTAVLVALAVAAALAIALLLPRPREGSARADAKARLAANAAIEAGVLRLDRPGTPPAGALELPREPRPVVVFDATEPEVTHVERVFQNVS